MSSQGIDLHYNEYSSIFPWEIDEESLKQLSYVETTPIGKTKKLKIKDLKHGDNVKLVGTIVGLVEQNPIFWKCPICNKTLKHGENMRCDDHPDAEPVANLIVKVTLDDGTSTIKAILFNEIAQQLLNMDASEALQVINLTGLDTAPIMKVKQDVLLKEVVVEGRVKYNERNDELELVVSSLKPLDVQEEIDALMEDIESLVE